MPTSDVPLTGEDIAKWRCQCKMPPMWNEQPGHAHLAEVLLNNSISPRSSLLMQRFLLLSTIWFTKNLLAIYMGCGAAVPMGRRRRRFTITHMGARQCNSRTSDSDGNCSFQICAKLEMRKWKGPKMKHLWLLISAIKLFFVWCTSTLMFWSGTIQIYIIILFTLIKEKKLTKLCKWEDV